MIAPTTVRNHLAAIYRELGVGNKADLIRLMTAGDQSAAADEERANAPATELNPAVSVIDRDADSGSPPVMDASERRHLTVMACELVGTTAAAGNDPEDLSELLQTYRAACNEVADLMTATLRKP